MSRPRTYSDATVVEAAKQAFWRKGFKATPIVDLERSTGLNRSSIYHRFGPKRQLFAAVLDAYVSDFIDPLLSEMEHGRPRLAAIAAFFSKLSAFFISDPRIAARGCLLINSIGEFPKFRDRPAIVAAGFPGRLESAFAGCLRGEAEDEHLPATSVDARANLLATSTLGLWQVARADVRLAADMGRSIAAEVSSWRTP